MQGTGWTACGRVSIVLSLETCHVCVILLRGLSLYVIKSNLLDYLYIKCPLRNAMQHVMKQQCEA